MALPKFTPDATFNEVQLIALNLVRACTIKEPVMFALTIFAVVNLADATFSV